MCKFPCQIIYRIYKQGELKVALTLFLNNINLRYL